MIDVAGKLDFIARQPRNWKVTAARASFDKLIYQMIFPYLGVYLVGLGASGTTLGLANGAGMAISALYGLMGAAFIRRSGTKRIYIGGLAIVAFSYLVLGLSFGWVLGVAGVMLYWLGSTEAGLCCNVVCGGSLPNEVRATAMGCCESVAQGTMGFIGPLVGAAVVGALGGLKTAAIRPLFFVACAAEIACLVFVERGMIEGGGRAACAKNCAAAAAPRSRARSNPFQLLRDRKHLGKFIAVACLTNLPTGMVLPFTQLFADQAKGADTFVLGAMVTGSAVASLVIGVPLGRLADRFGRKRVLFAMAPFFLASNLLLVFASSPAALIFSGILQGVFPVTTTIAAAMAFEQVAGEEIGDWMAVLRFFRMALLAALTVLAGLVWDHLGGRWVFILAAGIDMLVRLPLLASIPETLKKKA